MTDIRTELIHQCSLLPLQLRSLQILQMSFEELTSYIIAQAWQNPIIDLDTSEEWFYAPARCGRTDRETKRLWEQRADLLKSCNSLETFLLEQLPLKFESSIHRSALVGLIRSLDDKGYLRDSLEDLAKEWHIPLNVLEQALISLQALDPPGIGARNEKECLRLQALRAATEETPDVLRIIDNCLHLVAKGQYASICSILRLSRRRVTAAVNAIKRMNPYPGSGFDSPEDIVRIVPDIIVEQDGNLLSVRLSGRNSLSLRANKVYLAYMQKEAGKYTREYLKAAYNDFSDLCTCIQQRANTLLAIGHAITVLQCGFFLSEDCVLLPISQKDVAEMIGVSVSTVSRAIQNKYLRCRHGTYELKYFFARNMCAKTDSEQFFSSDAIQRAIRELISFEDCRAPLCDEEIAKKLADNGLAISRRTVAKYRNKLMIPNAFYRKKLSDTETECEKI